MKVRMSTVSIFAMSAVLAVAGTLVLGQADLIVGKTRPPNPEISGLTRAAGPRSDPTKTTDYSGVSGPGQPVVGTGYGGYRTGREGVMYRGPDSQTRLARLWAPRPGHCRSQRFASSAAPHLGSSSPRHNHLPGR